MNKYEESDDWVAPGFFYKLTRSQKYAIIYFLGLVAASDVDANSKINKEEFYFINFYYEKFKVSVENYLAYMAIGGKDQIIADLKSLSKLNLQGLVIATTELCNYSGNLNEREFEIISSWAESIGITMDEWNNYLDDFSELDNRPYDEEEDEEGD